MKGAWQREGTAYRSDTMPCESRGDVDGCLRCGRSNAEIGGGQPRDARCREAATCTCGYCPEGEAECQWHAQAIGSSHSTDPLGDAVTVLEHVRINDPSARPDTEDAHNRVNLALEYLRMVPRG